MTYSDHELIGVISDIYDAVGDVSKWSTTLARIGTLLGCHAGAIFFQNANNSAVGWATGFGIDESLEKLYREHYAALNPYFCRPDLVFTGSVHTSEMVLDLPSLMKTEFYNDWARVAGTSPFLAGTVFKEGPIWAHVNLCRGQKASPCGTEEMEFMRPLMPHLIRSLQLQHKIVGLESRCQALTDTLGRISQAVILLNAQGTVVFLNQGGQAVVNQCDGLKISAKTLCAQVHSENEVLQANIRNAALAASSRCLKRPGGNMVISRPSMRQPFCLSIVPIRPGAAIGYEDPAVAVLITDPTEEVKTSEEVLQLVFQLTPAEARLSQLLVRGMGLREAANLLGVSHNTVRTQLRSILAKTGTRRQSDLARVLAITGKSVS